jgi:hypothetical protein
MMNFKLEPDVFKLQGQEKEAGDGCCLKAEYHHPEWNPCQKESGSILLSNPLFKLVGA